MKAIVYDRYGPPENLRLEEVKKPAPTDNQLLIRIHAVSINGSDMENLAGKPLYSRFGGLLKPGNRILGSDIAGRVEFAGKNNTEFKAGDEVFGEIPGYRGGFAEYVCTHGRTLARKPPGMTFEQAAAIPQGGVIAWNGICQQGKVQAGQKVLINGAGGSAGTFAIQLARLSGAEVTGVDNTVKLDYMRSLGADHVVDYTREDFTRTGKQYDLILDLIARRPLFSCTRALSPAGTYFYVGGAVGVIFQILLFGPLIRMTRNKQARLLAVPQNRKDLVSITELCEDGKVVPVIDKSFPLEEVPDALRYVGQGLAQGKVVITMGS